MVTGSIIQEMGTKWDRLRKNIFEMKKNTSDLERTFPWRLEWLQEVSKPNIN